jgi:hypothetical protein
MRRFYPGKGLPTYWLGGNAHQFTHPNHDPKITNQEFVKRGEIIMARRDATEAHNLMKLMDEQNAETNRNKRKISRSGKP